MFIDRHTEVRVSRRREAWKRPAFVIRLQGKAAATRSETTVLRVGTQEVETLAQFQAQSGITFMQQTEVVADGSDQVHVIWWQSGEMPGTVCHGQLGGG